MAKGKKQEEKKSEENKEEKIINVGDLVEDDDEFEEFDNLDGEQVQIKADAVDQKPWLEDWDDEEDESDFANHLRKQIQQAMQEKA